MATITAEEVTAIVELAKVLAPPTLEFINNMIRAMDNSGLEGEDRMNAILQLQANLKPMEPVPE